MNRTVAYAYTGVVLTMFFWGSAFNAMARFCLKAVHLSWPVIEKIKSKPRLAIKKRSDAADAYTGVVLTMFFWGSAFNAMSYIIQHMPPLSAASERFFIASLGLLLIFSS
jgi:ABC-type sulfate transport system permease component